MSDARRLRPALATRSTAIAAVVLAVGFTARLSMVYLRGGSIADSPSYDTSVYYAAADALIHGRLPYRDFTLVHPPGVMLALTPFAVLGRLTTDHVGFVMGGLAWMVLGGLNAVLVMRILRQLQLGLAASAVGGLTYALWYESMRTEYALRLEPLGNALVLLGVLALVGPARAERRWTQIAGGAALGAAASVKIWYAVPLVLVLLWQGLDRDRRPRTLRAAAGAGVALLAVNGPFFLCAPRAMWSMVVADQFGRPYTGGSPLRRLANIASAGQTTVHTRTTVLVAIVVVGGALFLLVCGLAWRGGVGRLPAVLVLAQLAVLMTTPTFFLYYADYLAPAFALTVGAAAGQLVQTAGTTRSPVRRRLLWVAVGLPVAAGVLSLVAIDTLRPLLAVSPAPDRSLQAAVASARCVQSDTPMALIQLDVLSRDLGNGCQVWVDVIGRTYQAPLRPHGTVDGRPATRVTYVPWQRALRRYLLSGDALVVLDPRAAGIAPGTLRLVEHGPALAAADGYIVHGR